MSLNAENGASPTKSASFIESRVARGGVLYAKRMIYLRNDIVSHTWWLSAAHVERRSCTNIQSSGHLETQQAEAIVVRWST